MSDELKESRCSLLLPVKGRGVYVLNALRDTVAVCEYALEAEEIVHRVNAHDKLLEALYEALPYVEMAEHDEAYKKGAVKPVVNRIRALLDAEDGKGSEG